MNDGLLPKLTAAALGFVWVAVLPSNVDALQVTPYGSGVNPPGSLVMTSGVPVVGESFSVGIPGAALDDAPAALAFLRLATAPDPAFPSGTLVEGLGLGAPGAPGELLLSSSPLDALATLGPVPWAGGAQVGADFLLSVPLAPSLFGLSVYLQGAVLDLAAGPSLGVTNGLEVTLSAPIFPGLKLIQPGSFQMGSDAAGGAPYYGTSNEQPVHLVTISRPFWMGQYEVTQAEYQSLMGTNPSSFAGADRPVDSVTWFDAMAYCNALNAQQAALGKLPAGYQYRLPTEAEWEYACRAGTTTEFHYGADLFCNQARFAFTYHTTPFIGCLYPSGTAPVGSYTPNAWGLFDMHGNVREWCMDSFSLFSPTAKTDPYVSGGPFRVFRGGSWGYVSSFCRSAVRYAFFPGGADATHGFRVVLAPVLVP